jgi:AAA domain
MTVIPFKSVTPPTITATKFVYRDPKTIPPRETLYAGHFIRGFMSLTLGIGGGGKSNLEIVDALAMMSGMPLLGHSLEKRLKVWYINLEDPAVETERRFVAAAMHHGIKPDVLNDNLFMDSGRDQEFVVLKNSQKGTAVVEVVVAGIIQQMKERDIDVLIVDPFVSTHEVEENDNSKIQQVAAIFVRIANETNAAVEIVHHVRKGAGEGKMEVTADSGRGAGALKDKARSVRVINNMTAKEAPKAGVDKEDRFDYIRVGNGKSNLTKRSGRSEWRRMVSVRLNNGLHFWEPGDSVGVVTEWKWPSPEAAIEDVESGDFDKIKAVIAEGNCKANIQAKDWVGKFVADTLGLDLTVRDDKASVKLMIEGWIKAGHIHVVKRRCPIKREDKDFIDLFEAPHPEQGGAGKVLH